MELIEDPQFRTWQHDGSKWAVLTHHGVVAHATVEAGVVRLHFTKTSGANWHGELRYCPFAVAARDVLSLSFDARAQQPFRFSVWLGQRDSPHHSLVAPDNHFGEQTMTSQWQTFTHVWRPVCDEETARLVFVLGPIDNLVEIKAVRLARET